MRVIGIDPGLIATGYGIIDISPTQQLDCCAAGVIRPNNKDLAVRLLHIHQKITDLLREFAPEALAMEDLYTTYSHPKTAILMGHARGVIFLAASQFAIPVTNYAPTEVKCAVTNHGRASKEQVQRMVQRLLRLPELPTPDHVSDALALGICHGYRDRILKLSRQGRNEHD